MHSNAQRPQLELRWGYAARKDWNFLLWEVFANCDKSSQERDGPTWLLQYRQTFLDHPLSGDWREVEGVYLNKEETSVKGFPQDLKHIPKEGPASPGYGLITTCTLKERAVLKSATRGSTVKRLVSSSSLFWLTLLNPFPLFSLSTLIPSQFMLLSFSGRRAVGSQPLLLCVCACV